MRFSGVSGMALGGMVACLYLCVAAPLLPVGKKVLVLHSYHIGYVWTDLIAMGMRSVFQEYTQTIEVYEEYCDTKRYPPEFVFQQVRDMIRTKYEKDPPSIIVTSDDNALDFAMVLRKEFFPSVPIVFCGVNDYHPHRLRGERNITGVAENFDIPKSLELILRLHPGISYIAVVSDSTETGRYNMARLTRFLAPFERRVEFRFLLELTKEELAKELRALPPNGALLNLSFWRDRSGKALTYRESLSFLADNSPIPIYSLWDFMVNYGTVGGYVINGQMQGKMAAELAMRVLGGQSADSIPVIAESPNAYYFDYTALERWRIPLDALPEGSIVINQPKDNYKFFLYFLVTLIVAGGFALLSGLLWIQRKKLGRLLKEREVLIREIHHRVKNNLQVISSMLNLQKSSLFDPRDVFFMEDCRARVQSMALIHENLYESETLEKIRVVPYCNRLFMLLEQVYKLGDRRITLNQSIEDFEITLNESIPFGLVLVELLSNTARHGFPDRGGQVWVTCKREEKDRTLLLEITDTGIGFPPGFDPEETETLGLQLVYSLVSQMKGRVEWQSQDGVTARVRFPLST